MGARNTSSANATMGERRCGAGAPRSGLLILVFLTTTGETTWLRAGVPAKNRTWISGLGNPCSIR